MDSMYSKELSNFKEKTEKEKKEKTQTSPKKTTSEAPSGEDSLAAELFQFFGKIWYDYNSRVYFQRYPYREKEKPWILYSPDKDPEKNYSSFYATILSGYQYLDNETASIFFRGELQLTGILAVEASYRRYGEGRGFTSADKYLDFMKFVFSIPVIQYKVFRWDVYTGYSGFRKEIYGDGTSLGISLRIFPGGNSFLEFKTGQIAFDDIDFRELEANVGFSWGRVFFFGGYHAITSKTSELGGPQAGIQIWI